MNLKLLKKQYNNSQTISIFSYKSLICLLNVNNFFLKKKNKLNLFFKSHNIKFKFLKNKSNLFLKKKTFDLSIYGNTVLLYLSNQKNINFFDFLYGIKKEMLILLCIKYNNKFYDNFFFKKLLFYKNSKNLIFNFFIKLYDIKSPQKKLNLEFEI
jgi:hypothetical protein